MDIIFYKIENNTFTQADDNIKPEDWGEKIDWIDIRTNNRKEVVDYFRKLNLFNNVLDWIEHPEEYPFSNTFGKASTINIAISDAANIYKTDYISFLLEDKVTVTILPQASDIFNEKNLSIYSEKKYPSFVNFLFNVLVIKILAQNNVNISAARNRLQAIELMLTTDAENISSQDLMSCERDISQLSDIIEDQYVGFEILASLNSINPRKDDIQQINRLTKGFEPLDKSVRRLEKKAESLRLQYMLYQQEKSTKKINVLTIVQAVFVPLTFIAGVYGMNFVNMPELNWQFGYLLVWLVFVGVAGGLLSYFYRKGWFD